MDDCIFSKTVFWETLFKYWCFNSIYNLNKSWINYTNINVSFCMYTLLHLKYHVFLITYQWNKHIHITLFVEKEKYSPKLHFLFFSTCFLFWQVNKKIRGKKNIRETVLIIYWKKKWQPTPVFLPGESHGQRRWAGYTVHGVAIVRCNSAAKPPPPLVSITT